MKFPMKPRLVLLPLAAALCAINPSRAENPRALAEAPPPGAPKHDRFFFRQFDNGEKETVAFLGVETDSAPGVIAAQLNLPRGTGLVVRHVVPDSPAAAVLQENDVLTKLDDQILIDAHQLAVLIRNHKEGDEVRLTYLRAGKEATATVKLTQHEVPKMARLQVPLGPGGNFAFWAARPGELPEGGSEDMDRVLALLDRHREQPGPRPERIEIERPHGPGLRALSVNTGNSNMVYSDEKGSLELTMKDRKKSLVAKDAKGAQLFSGSIDTPEQRKALPPDVRERPEQLEGMDDFSFKADAGFRDDVKVLRPAREISLRRPEHRPPPPRAF
jgi:hypothetical protein